MPTSVGFAAVPPAIPSGESPAPLSVATTPLAMAAQGSPYSASLSATGGTAPYSWILLSGSPPPGLALSPGGIISGTPSAAGTFTFTVEGTDDTAPTPLTATGTLSISVVLVPLSITTTTLPNAIEGAAYAATLVATGGTAPYSWTVSDGSLPYGLTLSPSGAITGTPAGPGSATFTAQAIDATSPTPLAAS